MTVLGAMGACKSTPVPFRCWGQNVVKELEAQAFIQGNMVRIYAHIIYTDYFVSNNWPTSSYSSR